MELTSHSEPQPAYVGKHRDPTNLLYDETPGRHRRKGITVDGWFKRFAEGILEDSSAGVLGVDDTWEFLYPPDPIDELFDALRSDVCGPSDEASLPEAETRSP